MLKISATALAAVLLAGAAHAGPPKTIGPIFVIALENHNFAQPKGYTEVRQILHNPAAPYINSLILRGNPNVESSVWSQRDSSHGTDVGATTLKTN